MEKKDRWTDKMRHAAEKKGIERRDFLKGALVASAAIAGAGALSASVSAEGSEEGGDLGGSLKDSWDKFFQKHYKEMTAEDKQRVFRRIEREARRDRGVEVHVEDPQPVLGVKFAFALSLSKCNGSRFCVHACVAENNQNRGERPIQYIKVLEMDQGTLNVEKGNLYYDGESVPKAGKFYLPVQCHQCDNPPCTKVCPVEATWKEKDGIVVIDYDWCIGCRYCMAACPYEARRFNFSEPEIPKNEINPRQGYLSNRVRPRGVVEKCTFCLHRTRNGQNPACLEACPTGARKFGNILDPQSEVALILKHKRVFILKEDLGTVPSFFYYFD